MLKWFRDTFKSLRFCIFVILVAFAVIPCVVLRISILNAYETRAVDLRTSEFTSQAKLVASQIAANDYMDDLNSESLTTQLDQFSTLYDGRVILIDEGFRIVSDTYDMDEDKTILSEEVIRAYEGETVSTYDSENLYIELALPITESDSDNVEGVMLVSVSTDSISKNLEYLKTCFLILQVAVSITAILLGLFLSSILCRPLRRLTKSINDVQSGYERDLKPVNTFTETRKISYSCQEMMSQMKRLDDSRQEFVANVSHELKTPLTSVKVLADSLNAQEDAPIEVYKDFMQDIGSEIDREDKIINDLLTLVKMDRSASDMNIDNVNINDLLEETMRRLKPIADKGDVELVLESFRPVTAEVDRDKLSQVFTNLIENAIKYNNPGGWVHVSVNADHQYFFVKVEDNGIGIPEESQSHIFERFYRVDKSHSREIGGTGLGLSIARNAVIMHRGSIKVHSKLGEGSTFVVRIPLKFIENQKN